MMRKSQENNPIHIATPQINYLGINLTPKEKNFYNENCKIMKKEIK
jgi:hypothetical protein